jgi:hypothetical protein
VATAPAPTAAAASFLMHDMALTLLCAAVTPNQEYTNEKKRARGPTALSSPAKISTARWIFRIFCIIHLHNLHLQLRKWRLRERRPILAPKQSD